MLFIRGGFPLFLYLCTMEKHNRGSFKSNFGIMMAVAGSAVGLGNIWRFPYMAGMNGGAAFIILYLILVLLVGLPLILSEFSIGRAGRAGCVESFNKIRPGSNWTIIGLIAVVGGFTIMGFYSVIAGWTLYLIGDVINGGFEFSNYVEQQASFNGFVNNGWLPIGLSLLFIGLTAAIVMRGVEKGIEKMSKILMPMLVVILIILCINSMTMSGFGEAMNFLFTPDFSKITGQTVLDALGQVFFTLSIGMGVMITYSSYVVKDDNMVKSKLIVTIIDTSIAIISGIAIFPAVFSFGINPSEGPSLVFVTLPTLFSQMPFGIFVGLLFAILLFIAAITSAVSIFEMLTAVFTDKYKISRKKALIFVSSGVGVLAILSALSQVEGSNLMIFGLNIFDLLDTVSSNYLLTLGGLLVAIFTGWFFGKEKLKKVFTSNGRYNRYIFPIFLFVVRYISPVAVAAIFLSKLGFI